MEMSIKELIAKALRDTWERKWLAMALFVLFGIAFLITSILWPKVYTSSSTIFVEQQSTLTPLLPGAAVNQSAVDRAKIAREIIFSRKSMDRLLTEINWFDDTPTVEEKSKQIELIKKRTMIEKIGDKLLKVTFKDSLPKRAYQTTNLMTEIFIKESIEAKQSESRAAYDFIDKQVKEYHKKLLETEKAIKDFQSKNIEASPKAEAATDDRILNLRRQLEKVEMEIYEEQSKIDAIKKQLSGEVSKEHPGSIAQESPLNARIEQLETRLSELRLTYMDDYPDIVMIKSQIKDLKAQIKAENEARKAGLFNTNSATAEGSLAHELKRSYLSAQTNLSTLESRKVQIEALIQKERKNKKTINAVKAELAELSRDHDVNQQMYQKLLSQRENARISMNIDLENQGLTVKVQESASLPILPKGIRFVHIFLAGLVLSLAIPIGVCYGLNLLDPRIRMANVIESQFGELIIASVSKPVSSFDERQRIYQVAAMAFIAVLVWASYGYVAVQKLEGVL